MSLNWSLILRLEIRIFYLNSLWCSRKFFQGTGERILCYLFSTQLKTICNSLCLLSFLDGEMANYGESWNNHHQPACSGTCSSGTPTKFDQDTWWLDGCSERWSHHCDESFSTDIGASASFWFGATCPPWAIGEPQVARIPACAGVQLGRRSPIGRSSSQNDVSRRTRTWQHWTISGLLPKASTVFLKQWETSGQAHAFLPRSRKLSRTKWSMHSIKQSRWLNTFVRTSTRLMENKRIQPGRSGRWGLPVCQLMAQQRWREDPFLGH